MFTHGDGQAHLHCKVEPDGLVWMHRESFVRDVLGARVLALDQVDDITFDEAARALREAFDEVDDVRVDMEPVGRNEHVVSKQEKVSAMAEEAEYREFATLLGIVDDERPVRMVTMPQAEYDALKAESDKLGPMLDEMRTRPEKISEAEEREYEAFMSLIGPV